MSDFPVDSTKSAFQRLSSVRIRGDDTAPPKQASELPSADVDAAPVKIFNEVATRPENSGKAQVAVGGLQRAVSDLGETKETIERISTGSNPEIEKENQLAAQGARITDVEKASKLADELRQRIVRNEDTAKRAFDLNERTVQQLLS